MTTRPNRLRRGITIFAALLFVGLGIWLMLDPMAIEDLYAMSLNDDMAKSEIRAVFGGLMGGVGAAVLALDLVYGRQRDAAMALATVTAGLVVARIVGVVGEGFPTGPVLNETIFEVVLFTALVATGAYRRES